MTPDSEQEWLLDTSILMDLFRGSAAARTWIDSLPEDLATLNLKHFSPLSEILTQEPY